MPTHTSPRSSRFAFRVGAVLALSTGALALTGCSSSSTSSTGSTTTGLDPDVAQVMSLATHLATSKGIAAGDAKVTAQVSPVQDSWMRFTIAPKAGSSASFTPIYGFANQTQKWAIVTDGTSKVGCPSSTSTTGLSSGTAAVAVPLKVIESFGLSC